jgi:hypothetical protein
MLRRVGGAGIVASAPNLVKERQKNPLEQGRFRMKSRFIIATMLSIAITALFVAVILASPGVQIRAVEAEDAASLDIETLYSSPQMSEAGVSLISVPSGNIDPKILEAARAKTDWSKVDLSNISYG